MPSTKKRKRIKKANNTACLVRSASLLDLQYVIGMLVSRPDCRPPAPALTRGGRWEQLRPGAATHLPFVQVIIRCNTAKAGLGTGFYAPCFFRNFFAAKSVCINNVVFSDVFTGENRQVFIIKDGFLLDIRN